MIPKSKIDPKKDPLSYDSSKWGRTPSTEKDNFSHKWKNKNNAAMPTVIGAGAKKCGTGAFSFFMRQNHHFKGARGGEAHFFYDTGKWKKGFDAYSKHFRGYAKFVENAEEFGKTAVFEGTPRYLVEDLVPGRVKGEVKIFSKMTIFLSKNHKEEKFLIFFCLF